MWRLTFDNKKIVSDDIMWYDKDGSPVERAEIDGCLMIKNGDTFNEFKPVSEITQNDKWLFIFRVGSREFRLEKPGW